MRALFLVLAFGLGLVPIEVGAQSSQFKGLTAVSKELSNRIAPKDSPLELDHFIPAEDLEDLAGTWASFGNEHSFQNGLPNSVNMVILRVTLSSFARSMGASCQTPQLMLHPLFLATLQQLCAWPAAEAKTERVMLNFWSSVMGYSAPREEYLAWREFFLNSSYRDRPAAETVEAMTFSITMNPHFLLHK